MALIPIRIDRCCKPPLGTPLRTDGHWSVQGVIGGFTANEFAGSNLFDFAGKNNAAILNATWGDTSLKFNGSSSYAKIVTPTTDLKPAKISISIRFMRTGSGPSNADTIVSRDDAGANRSWQLVSINPDVPDTPRFILFPTVSRAYAPSAIVNNRWYDLTATYDGVASIVYLDGKPGTPVADTGGIANTNSPLWIGSLDGTQQFFNGDIEHLIIRNYALSEKQIVALSANPWQIYEPEIVWVEVGGGATTSPADPGGLTVTGSAATDYRGLISGAEAGAATISGVNATDYRGLVSSAETGTVATTGTDATGARTLISATETGTATTTGTNAADYVGHRSAAQVGNITTTGTDSTGVYTPVGSTTSAAQPGAVAVLGVNASGVRALISLTEPGAVNLTGVNASGFRGLLSVTETGALAVTGANATDIYTHGEWVSNALPGTLAVSGYAAESTITRLRRVIPITRGREIPTVSGRTIPIIH